MLCFFITSPWPEERKRFCIFRNPEQIKSDPEAVIGGSDRLATAGKGRPSDFVPKEKHVSAVMMGTQLLFFDTFSHEAVEELNLDLVQFPSPVVVEEVSELLLSHSCSWCKLTLVLLKQTTLNVYVPS